MSIDWKEKSETLLSMRQQGKSFIEIAEAIGTTPAAARGKFYRLTGSAKAQQPPTPKQDAPINSEAWDEYIDLSIERQKVSQKLSGVSFDNTIKVNEAGWFGIVFSGDWHVGNTWTSLDTVREESRIIANTEGMYAIMMGDTVDGGIPGAGPKGILNEQAMPAAMQRGVVAHILLPFAHKILLQCTGCHDSWAIDAADYDFVKELCLKVAQCPYIGGSGRFRLECSGGSAWGGYVSHKPRGHSQWNDLHPCVKAVQLYCPEAEIVAMAHEHIVATQTQVMGGKMRYFARTSTRKHYDRYGGKLGTEGKRFKGMPVPVLMLHGANKTGFWANSIETAAVFLDAARKGEIV